jgi:hypothetical protein
MEDPKKINEYDSLSPEDVQDNLEQLTNLTKKQQEKKDGIHTFATDIAHEVQGKNMSVIKIALAEQRRQQEYSSIVKQSKNQRLLYVLLATVFVVGGVLLIASSLNKQNETLPIPQTSQPKANSIIFSDDQIVFDVTDFSRSELVQGFRQKYGFVSTPGVTNIITIKESNDGLRTLSGAEFISIVGTNAPEALTPLLQKDFMVGFFQEQREKEVFVILQFDQFDTFVNQMREWEPFLLEDLITLFSITNTSGSILFSQPFNSEILLNKESRILRDQNQNFILGYTFADRGTVIITSSKETLTELLDRYSIQAIQ